jgi:predicted anti-sigma-YlaC factor YlaD
MTSCREIRQALGVYVLGAIDPAERAQVDEHLATCPDCREELASLAGLPAMLRKVPVVEAERLAAPDAERDAAEAPSEAILKSLVAHTANVRRIHRWRNLAVAAAVVVLALGGGVAVGHALQSSPPSSSAAATKDWKTVTTTDAAGTALTVKYRQVQWGTTMLVHVAGLQPGSVCQFMVTDSTGQALPAGGWVVKSWKGSAWFPATTWFNDSQLRGFELAVNGKVVASVHGI